MSVKALLPVVGYLYWAIDKAMFLCPGTEYIAASLFMCCGCMFVWFEYM